MRKFALTLLWLAVFACAVAAILQGKTKAHWGLTDVTGNLPDLHFALTNDNGKPVTEKDYRGEVALLYFGFTHCPDLCPVTLARMTTLFKHMGSDADGVRLLFVSVDPQQDTPQALRDFLKSFDPRHMTGLTGKEGDIHELAKRYRAAYQPAGGGKTITHGDAIYIFDGAGHARLLSTPGGSDDIMLKDLKRLAHDGGN